MAKFTIGALATETGVHLETIRYYERTGLIPRPLRTPSGHRAFDDRAVERLRLIRCARELGFSTDVIKELVLLAEERPEACEEANAFAKAQIERIAEKIRE